LHLRNTSDYKSPLVVHEHCGLCSISLSENAHSTKAELAGGQNILSRNNENCNLLKTSDSEVDIGVIELMCSMYICSYFCCCCCNVPTYHHIPCIALLQLTICHFLKQFKTL